jgi:tRNA(Ile)-lysidine synthase
VRPLLQVRRNEIDAFLKAKRLKFREDSSNKSQKHRRNRLRHEVMPLLNDVFARDVSALITRLGVLADRDDDGLESLAVSHVSSLGGLNEDRSLPVTKELLALHPAVLSRVIAFWLREVWGLAGIENDCIESAMEMLAADGPSKINLPCDKHLRRKAKRLWVE